MFKDLSAHSTGQVYKVVGIAGFGPAAFPSQAGRATKLRHTPKLSQLTVLATLNIKPRLRVLETHTSTTAQRTRHNTKPPSVAD